MEIKRKVNIHVRRTVERSVGKRDDFHFHVDELTSRDYMPTYAGRADEKYLFDEMDGDFFEFVSRKIAGDGIYIRLVFASGELVEDEAVFNLEYADSSECFKTDDLDNVCVFEFADFGIKVRDGLIVLEQQLTGDAAELPILPSSDL